MCILSNLHAYTHKFGRRGKEQYGGENGIEMKIARKDIYMYILYPEKREDRREINLKSCVFHTMPVIHADNSWSLSTGSLRTPAERSAALAARTLLQQFAATTHRLFHSSRVV
jgi:hypothetical protein